MRALWNRNNRISENLQLLKVRLKPEKCASRCSRIDTYIEMLHILLETPSTPSWFKKLWKLKKFELLYFNQNTILRIYLQNYWICTSHVNILRINNCTHVFASCRAFNSYTFRIRSYDSQKLIRVRSIAKIFFARLDFARAYIQKRYRGRDTAANERIRLIIRDRDCLVNYSADEWFVN